MLFGAFHITPRIQLEKSVSQIRMILLREFYFGMIASKSGSGWAGGQSYVLESGLFSRIQSSQGKPAVIEKFVFWILCDSISCVKISMSNQKFYIVSKLCNWLLRGKYRYSKSEYKFCLGKKEAPLLDTDL